MMKKLLCLVIVCLLTFGLVSTGGSAGFGEKQAFHKEKAADKIQYTAHSPIRINNNTDFTKQFSNRTIWNLDINGTNNVSCIYIGNCSQTFTVKNCYLHDATGVGDPDYHLHAGLVLYNSTHGLITHNNASNNYDTGIYLKDSSYNTITYNKGFDMSYGICLYEMCNYNIITNNIVTNNTNGIMLTFSVHTTITNNNIYGNVGFGIYLGDTGNTLVMFNNITGNFHQGMYLNNAAGNQIYKNNFINNSHGPSTPSGEKQAYDNTNYNHWSVTSTGNYWSDWTTPDLNHDGIVDTPYILNGSVGANDSFPLVNLTGPGVSEFSISPSALVSVIFILSAVIVVRRRSRRRGRRSRQTPVYPQSKN